WPWRVTPSGAPRLPQAVARTMAGTARRTSRLIVTSQTSRASGDVLLARAIGPSQACLALSPRWIVTVLELAVFDGVTPPGRPVLVGHPLDHDDAGHHEPEDVTGDPHDPGAHPLVVHRAHRRRLGDGGVVVGRDGFG